MKNNQRLFIGFGVVLVVVLVVAYFSSQPSQTNEQSTVSMTSSTSEQTATEPVKIGVLQLLSHEALDAIYRGMEEELARQGYIEGESIEIDLQNAQGDQSNLALMSEKLITDQNDILVGITTPASQALANGTKELPIILGAVTYPVEAGLINSEQQPGGHITGVSDRTPIKQQLELIKQVLPQMQTVGILYTASEDNAVKQAQEAQMIAQELGLKVKSASISNTNDLQQVAENLASEVDALFVPIDNTIASAMPTLVQITDAHQIGVFPSADTMVADGGVIGIGVDQYQVGVEIAHIIIRVIKGEQPGTIPLVLANRGIVYLNEAKAAQLGIEIPASIKANATRVDQ